MKSLRRGTLRKDRGRPAPMRLVVLVLLTCVALLIVDGRGSAVLSGGRGIATTAVRPIMSLVTWAASPIGAAVDGATGEIGDLRAENQELRAELAELRGQLDQAANNEAELAELRRAADIQVADSLPTLVARVTADRTTLTDRTFDIDRGSDHGVRVGQPVVTGEGLVGQIIATEAATARVRPLTDPRVVVGVTSPVSGAVGVVQGTGTNRRLSLDLVERDREVVRSGVSFITSGFDRSAFPPGIAIGTFQLDEGGDLTLVPSADLERPGFVSIILTAGEE